MAAADPQVAIASEQQREFFTKSSRQIADTIYYLSSLRIRRGLEAHISERLPSGLPIIFNATMAIFFSCKPEPNARYLETLAAAAGESPERQAIRDLVSVHYKLHIDYIGAVFFLLLTGLDITPPNVFKVVEALNLSPDIDTAIEAVDVFKKVAENDRAALKAMELDPSLAPYEANLSLKRMSEMIYEIFAQQARDAMANPAIAGNMSEKLLVYLAATAPIVLSGREISKRDILAIVANIGMGVDDNLATIATSGNYKNEVVYVGPTNFVYETKMGMTPDNLVRVAGILDLYPDMEIAERMIAMFKGIAERIK